MKIKKRPKSTTKKIIASSAAILLIGVASYTTYAAMKNTWPFTATQKNTSTQEVIRGTNSVDYSGSTTEDVTEGQNAKKRLASESETDKQATQPTHNNLNDTPVAVSFADRVEQYFEIRAFIPNVIEGTGICTATFRQGDDTITASSQAFVDSTSSQCKPISVPIDRLSQHDSWSVTVIYESSTSRGSSESIEVKL